MQLRGLGLAIAVFVGNVGCANLIGLSDLEEVDCIGAACADAATTDTRVEDSTGIDTTVDSEVPETAGEDVADTADAGDAAETADAADTADTAPACEVGPSACGSCDRACSSVNVDTLACADGFCTSTCTAGYGNCKLPAAPTVDDGCETKLDSLTNCGACGSACDTTNSLGAACDGTKCTYTGCKPGFFDCDTSGTNANGCETPAGAVCGSCSTSCDVTKSDGAMCTGGTKCTYTGCKTGFANCNSSGADYDGCETSTKTATDCTGCGKACDTANSIGAACTGTTCTYSGCKAGWGNCSSADPDLDGCETPVTTTANCGGCGVRCNLTGATSASCDGSKCSYACSSATLDCNAGVAPNTDGCESSKNSVETCGSCGTRCDSTTGTPSCDGSKCSYSCGAGRLDCDTTAPNTNGCESLATSVNSCGSCANRCDTASGTPSCDGSKCSYVCASGKLDCNAATAPNLDGCETSATSVLNCGACGNRCNLTNASGATCDGSKCGYTCASGFGDCNVLTAPNTDGCETQLNSVTNCSGCGLACDTATGTPSCNGVRCSYACSSGRLDCNATSGTNLDGCESSSTSPLTCGGCTNVCNTSTTNNTARTCDGTKCGYTCAAGKLDCNAATAPNTDGCETTMSVTNCGGCGTTCSTATGTPTCTAGKCAYTCNAGRADCNAATGTNTDGCECATPGCCSGGCQTTHSNGLGQNFYDCVALGTINATQAASARAAWAATQSGVTNGAGLCQTGSDKSDCLTARTATSCATWCYDPTSSLYGGKVVLNTTSTCICPTSGVTWN